MRERKREREGESKGKESWLGKGGRRQKGRRENGAGFLRVRSAFMTLDSLSRSFSLCLCLSLSSLFFLKWGAAANGKADSATRHVTRLSHGIPYPDSAVARTPNIGGTWRVDAPRAGDVKYRLQSVGLFAHRENMHAGLLCPVRIVRSSNWLTRERGVWITGFQRSF